jgi:hypothetical protein
MQVSRGVPSWQHPPLQQSLRGFIKRRSKNYFSRESASNCEVTRQRAPTRDLVLLVSRREEEDDALSNKAMVDARRRRL